MVRDFGYVGTEDFAKATAQARAEFAKIFAGTDYLQGGEPYYKHILQLIKPKQGQRLIDLGYGRGFFLREAEKHGLKLAGLDFCEASKAAASRVVTKAMLAVGDIHNIPYKDNTFDFVSCLGTIEHLVKPQEGIREIARILKPSGVVVMTIPNSIYFYSRVWLMYAKYLAAKTLNLLRLRKKPAVFIRQPIDRFYTPKEGQRLLEKNGLRVFYAETLKSKRQDFGIGRQYSDGQVKFDPSFFTTNFTLYLCRKR